MIVSTAEPTKYKPNNTKPIAITKRHGDRGGREPGDCCCGIFFSDMNSPFFTFRFYLLNIPNMRQ